MVDDNDVKLTFIFILFLVVYKVPDGKIIIINFYKKYKKENICSLARLHT